MATSWDVQSVQYSNQGLQVAGEDDQSDLKHIQHQYLAFIRSFRQDNVFVYRYAIASKKKGMGKENYHGVGDSHVVVVVVVVVVFAVVCGCVFRFSRYIFRVRTHRRGCVLDVLFRRDQLQKHLALKKHLLEVDLEDLKAFNPQMADDLINAPSVHMPQVGGLVWSVCRSRVNSPSCLTLVPPKMHPPPLPPSLRWWQFEHAAAAAAKEISVESLDTLEHEEDALVGMVQVILRSRAVPIAIRHLSV
jgi:MCM N-terminal domain